MGKWDALLWKRQPNELHYGALVVDPFTDAPALIDVGVLNDVLRLWDAGVRTWVSCEGDSVWERYVGLTHESDAERAAGLLPWCGVVVMDRRYRLTSQTSLRPPDDARQRAAYTEREPYVFGARVVRVFVADPVAS